MTDAYEELAKRYDRSEKWLERWKFMSFFLLSLIVTVILFSSELL